MFTYENVWQQDSLTKREVIDFWLQEGVLPSEEEAIKRAEQLVFVARDSNTSKIVGVCTVYINYVSHLINQFYFYRSYVTQGHRGNILGSRLFMKSYDLLNKIYQEEQEKKAIGIIMEIENKQLAENTKAVWSIYGRQCVFIGVNQKGNHMRVTYFEGAKIS